MLGYLIKKAVYLQDMHLVTKCSLFRCGAGMWKALDVGAVGHRPCTRPPPDAV